MAFVVLVPRRPDVLTPVLDRLPTATRLGSALALVDGDVHVSPAGLVEGYSLTGGMRQGADLAAIAPDEAPAGGLAGAYAFARLDGETLTFGTDFWGARQLYFSEHRDLAIVSTSLHWHALALRLAGLSVAPDYWALLGLVGAGWALSPGTSLEGVSLLPCRARLRTTGDRLLVDPAPDVPTGDPSDLIEAAAAEIRANAAAALEAAGDRRVILELTGGFDSRLALAAIMKAGGTDRVHGYSRGATTDPDRTVASTLLAALGRPAASEPYSYEDVTPEAFQHAALATGAMRMVDDCCYYTRTPYPDRAIFTGGMGESFRNLFGEFLIEAGAEPHLRAPGTDAARIAAWNKLVSLRDVTAPHREYFVDLFGRLEHAHADAIGPAARESTFGDFLHTLYVERRNRFHFGACSVNRNRLFLNLEVLAARSTLAASRTVDAVARARGATTLQLLTRLAPELLAFPFAEKAVPAELFRDRLLDERFVALLPPPGPPQPGLPVPVVQLDTRPGAPPNTVREAFIAAAAGLLEQLPANAARFFAAERVAKALRDSRKAYGTAKRVVGPFGWIVAMQEIAALTPTEAATRLQ